jgi:peptidoglycan hydrolase CwlO-like protein
MDEELQGRVDDLQDEIDAQNEQIGALEKELEDAKAFIVEFQDMLAQIETAIDCISSSARRY